MAAPDILIQFVRDALIAGCSRDDIRTALETAGWSGKQISAALAVFSEIKFTLPVPQPRPRVTTRDAFIYALLFIALFSSAAHLVVLGLELMEFWLWDADGSPFMTNSVQWSIAVLIVMAPLFIGLTLSINRQIAA